MAKENAVIECHTLDQWNQQLKIAKESEKKMVIDFTASSCGPCSLMAPLFADLARKFPYGIFLKVDIDELKTVAKDFAIQEKPTFIFMSDGAIVDKLVGVHKNELIEKVEELMTSWSF